MGRSKKLPAVGMQFSLNAYYVAVKIPARLWVVEKIAQSIGALLIGTGAKNNVRVCVQMCVWGGWGGVVVVVVVVVVCVCVWVCVNIYANA